MSGTKGVLAGSRLSMTPVDGGEVQPGPGSQNDESTLDIEDVSALAPEADIDVYEAPNTTSGGIDEYAQIMDTDIDQIVTSSWVIGCEQLAQLAAPASRRPRTSCSSRRPRRARRSSQRQGTPVTTSATRARAVPPPSGQNLLSVSDPASQPYVLSVGGTTIDDATQPPAEHVWDDGA